MGKICSTRTNNQGDSRSRFNVPRVMEILPLEILKGMEMPGLHALLKLASWALGLQQLCERTKTNNKLR